MNGDFGSHRFVHLLYGGWDLRRRKKDMGLLKKSASR
jgi:hypothetical protein